jgi:hypothetical protein
VFKNEIILSNNKAVFTFFFTCRLATILALLCLYLFLQTQEPVVDEYGAEPMDLVVIELFAIKPSSRTQSLMNKISRSEGT